MKKFLVVAAAVSLLMGGFGAASSFAQSSDGSDDTFVYQMPFRLDLQASARMPRRMLNSPLSLGSVLPNYAVVSVGPNASIMVNSGPISGSVLLGDGTTSSSSGGNNGRVTGHVDVSPTV